ncbi:MULTISPECIES: LysR family transcriptional regulator [unclassified Brenneria]|uniref:LysR family transcriptional regulator n=1 Tax=unclassified Brenneria TaxID=2634434 RepID=UPI0029C43B8C|nr:MULTISPECIES: LysR family transcriptional regulator [unclassified Brenneria]MDX5629771.1 LysR family transcriptional regulator [Brenneria sp. L3-3Z]MDX5696917.1 LysR family transcriptional regulator [Brenneria sp. L4-2C]
MMNWDNARYLLAVARTGSLRAAAACLGVDQATVARRLRSLEQQLNTSLFHRSPEGYRLTASGKQLLPDIERMEATAASIERKSMGMNASLAGKVHIASTDSLARCFLLPALHELQQACPNITITLSTAPDVVDIRRGEADLAVRSARPTDSNLIIRRLATLQLGLYASGEYVSRRGRPVPGNAFSGHDLVMFPQETVPQYWQRLCGEPLTNGRIVLETNSQWMYIEALRQGQGIGMMAREIMQRCCPELINVMPARSEPADIWLVVNPDVWSAGRVQATISAISDCFKNLTLSGYD